MMALGMKQECRILQGPIVEIEQEVWNGENWSRDLGEQQVYHGENEGKVA